MLRQANCVKQKATAIAFSLQADAGESFLIKSIIFADALTTGYPVLRVDRKTVGCYRGGAQGVQHLGGKVDAYIPMNLMDWLKQKNINMSIPVAEGLLTLGQLLSCMIYMTQVTLGLIWSTVQNLKNITSFSI